MNTGSALHDRVDDISSLAPLEKKMLRTLAAQGLLVMRLSKCSIVRKLGVAEVHSMLKMLAEAERPPGRLTRNRASEAGNAELLDVHDRMIFLGRPSDRVKDPL